MPSNVSHSKRQCRAVRQFIVCTKAWKRFTTYNASSGEKKKFGHCEKCGKRKKKKSSVL